MRRAAIAVLPLLLLVAACGNDDHSYRTFRSAAFGYFIDRPPTWSTVESNGKGRADVIHDPHGDASISIGVPKTPPAECASSTTRSIAGEKATVCGSTLSFVHAGFTYVVKVSHVDEKTADRMLGTLRFSRDDAK